MKNIHILPTEHTSRLYYNSQERTYQLCEFPKYHTDIKSTHNLYITNSEEIKEGDWGLSKNNYLFHFLDKISICNYVKDFNYKKIILTTDDQLIKDGVQAIDDEFLEWFVNKANDSGKAIDIVEVEKEQYHTFVGMKKYPMIPNYKIIIPKEEPKQYKCTECNWLGLFDDMKNEQDTDYDQYCCPKCNNVMYDCRLHKWYLEEPKQKTIEEVLKKIKSIKLCLMAHPNNEVDSEFADIISDLEEIEIELSKQQQCYSEKKVLEQLNILMSLPSSTLDKFTDENGNITIKWFEQMKNK